jgi:hypothetical protein
MQMGRRIKALVVALTLVAGVCASAMPAHGDADTVDNHLCLDTGFGFYGVSDHVHITDTTGTYHISTFGQGSAWSYSGTGTYCRADSVVLPCPAYVFEVIFQNGSYLATTTLVQDVNKHTVSTGSHSFGTVAANYLVESYVQATFGNGCTSEADGQISAYDYN